MLLNLYLQKNCTEWDKVDLTQKLYKRDKFELIPKQYDSEIAAWMSAVTSKFFYGAGPLPQTQIWTTFFKLKFWEKFWKNENFVSAETLKV